MAVSRMPARGVEGAGSRMGGSGAEPGWAGSDPRRGRRTALYERGGTAGGGAEGLSWAGEGGRRSRFGSERGAAESTRPCGSRAGGKSAISLK